MIKIVVHRGH